MESILLIESQNVAAVVVLAVAYGALLPALCLPFWEVQAHINIPALDFSSKEAHGFSTLSSLEVTPLGAMLFVWNFVLPLVKLGLLVSCLSTDKVMSWRGRATLLSVVQKVSKWAMLNFFYVCATLALTAAQPAITLGLGTGGYFSCAYCLLSTGGALLLPSPSEVEPRGPPWDYRRFFCQTSQFPISILLGLMVVTVLILLCSTPALQLMPNAFIIENTVSVFGMVWNLWFYESPLASAVVLIFGVIIPAVHALALVASWGPGFTVFPAEVTKWVRCLSMLDVLAVGILAAKILEPGMPDNLVSIDILWGADFLLTVAGVVIAEAVVDSAMPVVSKEQARLMV